MSRAGNPRDLSSSSSSSGSACATGGHDGGGVEVIRRGTRCVEVMKPAAVYSIKDGSEITLPTETVKAVDDFIVPTGYRREGSRAKSFMYSLGVYVKPVDPTDSAHKYFCLASPSCRQSKRIVKCSSGDRSNVNTHIKKTHDMCGAQKADKKKAKQTAIEKSITASKNPSVGTNR